MGQKKTRTGKDGGGGNIPRNGHAEEKNPKLNSTTKETTTNDHITDLWHILAKL